MEEAGEIALALDLRGLKCPHPVMWTEKKIAKLQSGDIISVDTTDPLASIDIPHFCSQSGHQLLLLEKTDAGHRFVIRKG